VLNIYEQYEDALSIAAAVIIVGTVAFVQEYRSEQSLEALTTLVPPKCHVLRGRIQDTILAVDIVPGDIIHLRCGDRVPADARIISCTGFSVDESSLTGEQDPKDKVSDALPDVSSQAEITNKRNMVFMGTLVSTGSAQAVVISTALGTEFGKTFQDMKDVEDKKTPLQIMMDELGKQLSMVSFGIIVCIGILGVFQGKEFMAMFNIGVSLAVAAIPEGLPICVTVTLALGVMRMARRNAVCKKLPAVESLGCANYICTDKTGTLTQNKMTVSRAFSPCMEDVVEFHTDTRKQDTPDDVLSPSTATVLPRVTLWQNGKNVDIHEVNGLYPMMDAFCLCNNAHISPEGQIIGQPTEGALLIAAAALGVPDRRPHVTRTVEGGFSSDRKRMEISCLDGSLEITYVKGAVEVLLPDCTHFLGKGGDVQHMKSGDRERINQQSAAMANDGLRVLLVASADSKQVSLAFIAIVYIM
jgi:P-type Ca2+ transporter type 2C